MAVTLRTEPVTVVVRGLPIAQGSARAFVAGGRAIVATQANRTSSPLGAWRTAIATEARDEMADRPLLEGPLKVSVVFIFPRPKGHYLPVTKSRPAPVLRADAPVYHDHKPDVDKLERALLDAVKLVVWRDDAQVVDLRGIKVYETAATDHAWQPGAEISIGQAPGR